MKPNIINQTDQQVLQVLCSDPWSIDREIAAKINLKHSTFTASKNRLKTNGICKKAYFPAYQRLGYPLVSFSQLCNSRPPQEVQKALSKHQDTPFNEANRSMISYQATDPFNTFVMAHHRTYSDFKMFERVLRPAEKWSHELCTMVGATKVVNFNYTNTINRLFFPGQFQPFKPKMVNNSPYDLHRAERKVFYGLMDHQGMVLSSLSQKIDVTRQSVVKLLYKFKQVGLLEKSTVVDLGRAGLQLGAAIIFKMNGASNEDISKLNRALGPFYYWVFDDVHVLLTADTDYKAVMTSLGKLSSAKGISDLRTQLVNF